MPRILFIIISVILLPILASAQLLYKIDGNGLEKPSYLFGTHHLAPISFLDSITGMREAVYDTDAVIGEIDMTGEASSLSLAMLPYMTAPADSTLSRLYTPKQFDDLNNTFVALDILPGLNLYAFDAMKPLVVANLVTIALYQKSMPDFDPTQQLDRFFQQNAADIGKKVIPLESVEQQASLLYDFEPLDVQAEALAELLYNPDEVAAAAGELNKAYLRHDIFALKQLSFKDEDHPEFMDALVSERNARWLSRLPGIMAGQSVLIAVGALHLPGDDGLIEGLRKLGFSVTPLDSVSQQ